MGSRMTETKEITLLRIVIIAAILGIFAAIVIPHFLQANQSPLKTALQIGHVLESY